MEEIKEAHKKMRINVTWTDVYKTIISHKKRDSKVNSEQQEDRRAGRQAKKDTQSEEEKEINSIAVQ